MSNNRIELVAQLDALRAQALEMALIVPPRIAAKLRENVLLQPSKYDFDADHEEKYGLEARDTPSYLDAAKLINDMRNVRKKISNLDFAVEQDARPPNAMTVSEDHELN